MLTFGVECDCKLPRAALRCVQLLGMISAFPFTYVQVMSIVELFWSKGETFSCVDMAVVLNNAVSVVVALQVMTLFRTHKTEIEDIFQPEPIETKLMFCAFISNLPFEASVPIYLLEHYEGVDFVGFLFRVAASYTWRSLLAFDVCYLHLCSVLKLRQQRIQRMVHGPLSSTTVRCVMNQKWALRDAIKNFNKFCGATLTMYYLKIFFAIISSAGQLFCLREMSLGIVSSSLAHCTYICIAFLVAHEGSQLISLCIDTHSVARRLANTELDEAHRMELRDVLKFKRRLDCLTVSLGFSMEMPVLASFFGSCVTVAAIFLQFDYQVVKKVNRISARID